MRRVGLIDITVGNAARFGASQRSTTRRCASHHIATQRASRWGNPGGLARLARTVRLKRLWLRGGHMKRNACERMNSPPRDVPSSNALNSLSHNLSFHPDEVIAMNQAYDLACRTLQNVGQLEVDREIIAGGILQVQGAASGTPTNTVSVLSMD